MVAMQLLSAFTHFIHGSHQPSHTVERSGQNSPVDDAVLVDAKGDQVSLCRDDSTATLTRSPSMTPSASDSICSKKPQAIYDGGYDEAKIQGVHLRIANGGAGQTGLIRAWADEFIKYMVSKGLEPFEVAWYLGDTTDSLGFLSSGIVDVSVTYNAAAEKQLLDVGDAVERVYGFRDHFILVGPMSNPAGLEENDDILTMFNKIVARGNVDVITPPDPNLRPATRFLSRFDKSATNIKESQIFITIGQVPWALDYSKWYHQYERFPSEALQAAALLSEYTLTDLGSWFSAQKSISSRLKVFKCGSDDANDPLLNPAHVLRGKRASVADQMICEEFMSWVVSPTGGQKVIESFSKNGHISLEDQYYS